MSHPSKTTHSCLSSPSSSSSRSSTLRKSGAKHIVFKLPLGGSAVRLLGGSRISSSAVAGLRFQVVIYLPARTATQQGSGKVGRWKINFVSTQKF
ncbi:hypothetical protein NL676_000241 [Syzygium grande]|nr:hypothetical protein NL676_000241 [Syzygium grande]